MNDASLQNKIAWEYNGNPAYFPGGDREGEAFLSLRFVKTRDFAVHAAEID